MIAVKKGVPEDLRNWFLPFDFDRRVENAILSDRYRMSVKYDRWGVGVRRRCGVNVRGFLIFIISFFLLILSLCFFFLFLMCLSLSRCHVGCTCLPP